MLAACGDAAARRAAVTTLTPPPGSFNDRVAVVLATDIPATVYATTDGSDPKKPGAGRHEGASPLSVELTATTTLSFYSRTPAGVDEAVRTAQYVRAGGRAGTISGVVVVGSIAVGKDVGLGVNLGATSIGRLEAPGEIPFTLENLDTGSYRLTAIADRNGDGQFLPILDYTSDTITVAIDLADPFKSSAEDVRLYLGAAAPGLCAITGKVTLHDPSQGQNVSIAAISPDAFMGAIPGVGGGGGAGGGGGGGSGFDPTVLLSALRNGYQAFTNGTDTEYPYAITGLECGRYLAVPMLTGFGGGGMTGLNLLVNPLGILDLMPGDTAEVDFEFGPVHLTGNVTVHVTGDMPGFAWGFVVARSATLLAGIQAILMPVLFGPGPDPDTLRATYGAGGMRKHGSYDVRVFPSTDPQNPIAPALMWAINPMSSDPPMVTVQTGSGDATQDVVVP